MAAASHFSSGSLGLDAGTFAASLLGSPPEAAALATALPYSALAPTADAGALTLESPARHFEQTLPALPGVRRRRRAAILKRTLECLPAAVTLTVLSSLVWAPVVAPMAFVIAVLSFHAYWTWRATMNGTHAVKGYFILRRHRGTDWRGLYEEHRGAGKPCLDWDDTRHIVIIPNYTESADKLRLGLDSLAASEVASQLVVVLAMEEREGDEGRRRAELLEAEYAGRLGMIFSTFHPWGVPGEVAGKGSNEAWAARQAKREVVDRRGHDIDLVTITSCDADTVFDAKYFSCLTYGFATHANRYRRFWQAPIFFYNNIWDVPAPLRMAHCLSGLNHIARLSRSVFRMVFPQSTYSLSLRLAHEVDYWDPEVIPEDWHMFLRCYYQMGGEVDVEAMYTPLYMDGVRSRSYLATFMNYFQQSRRHAWGCTDIAYAIQQSIEHPEIPLWRRVRRVWAVAESHLLWSTQWFLITTSKVIPFFFAAIFGVEIPIWFPVASYWILLPCLATLILLLTLDAILRPRRPASFRWWLFPLQYGVYFFMAIITFFTSALPALDAQFRLALGKRLEYRVTEKA
ncbi:MAG: glycosyltransferase family 2 protein [Dehalococcoidia bacterium]|nr:glycosyltransferase family 2 protein [Dehalococcoidia bacterium]